MSDLRSLPIASYQESGRRIAARRNAKGLSQATLANLVQVAQSTLADWERGKTRPRPAALSRLAVALACRPGELIPELEPNGFFIHSNLPQDKAQEFHKYRLEHDSLEHLYLALFDEVYRFTFEIYRQTSGSEFEEGWSFGSIRVSKTRQAVLTTKRLWERALVDADEQPLAERVMKELDAHKKFLREWYETERISDVSLQPEKPVD